MYMQHLLCYRAQAAAQTQHSEQIQIDIFLHATFETQVRKLSSGEL
jgi:hypothetical protein